MNAPGPLQGAPPEARGAQGSPVSQTKGPLGGVLVVALEQAVAAPYCSSRLADAGARVIKVERPEGDFARGYDRAVFGESAYFVWVNRGKESVVLDLRQDADRARLRRLVAAADVFLQNLAPGAAARLGFGSDALRAAHPRLVTCDISGYGEQGPRAHLKAYDLLVQAESGLVAVNGAPGPWGRVGVSICDIAAGMNAIIGIQQALLQRARSGCGSAVEVSLFDSAAELMTVPYLHARYGGRAPARVGLRHPSIAPYGACRCADGREIVIAVQNEREWVALCATVLGQPALASDPRFADNPSRVAHRDALEAALQSAFGALDFAGAEARLNAAGIAYGAIHGVDELVAHPQLRTRPMPVGGSTAELPAPGVRTEWDATAYTAAPALGAHAPLPGGKG